MTHQISKDPPCDQSLDSYDLANSHDNPQFHKHSITLLNLDLQSIWNISAKSRFLDFQLSIYVLPSAFLPIYAFLRQQIQICPPPKLFNLVLVDYLSVAIYVLNLQVNYLTSWQS